MGHRLTKIYTRTGDKGTTGLGDGTRVGKDAPRVEAYGALDELNSHIGLVLAYTAPPKVADCLTEVQQVLFDLGGDLCIPSTKVISTGWNSGWIISITNCLGCRISYCPAEIRPRHIAMSPVPSAAGPNGCWFRWEKQSL